MELITSREQTPHLEMQRILREELELAKIKRTQPWAVFVTRECKGASRRTKGRIKANGERRKDVNVGGEGTF
jgi:hypothetical protein